MPAYGNSASTPSAHTQSSRNHKQAFIAQAQAWVGLSENPGDNNGFSGSYRQIINIVDPSYHSAWCAMFVSACAKQAGISNIIPTNSWAYGIGEGIFAKGGHSIPGQASSWHCDVNPEIGDTVHFGRGGAVDANGFPTANGSGTVSHVGIVVSVDKVNRQFTTVEGNTYGDGSDIDRVMYKTYPFSKSNIYYCARPNWEAVGGFSEPVILNPNGDVSTDSMSWDTNSNLSVPYTGDIYGVTVYNDVRNGNPNDRHDMTLREIGYFGDNSRFVTEPTDITISAINYTTLLGNLYDQFATYYPYGYTADTSRLDGNVRVCVDFFKSKGLNPAVACGITASLFTLSGIGTVYKGGGICAWEGKYRQDMHIRVDDWETNLSGQLDYLWIDLSLNYGIMMQLFTKVPVTDNGARQAANRFIVSYRYTDQPQDVDTEVANSTKAQRIAAEWFNQLIINPIIPEGSTYSSPQSVTIPVSGSLSMTPISLDYAGGDTVNPAIDDVLLPSPQAGQIYSFAQCPYPQSGIDTNFTSYSYWADRFNQSSPQYQLAQIWKNQYNMSCNRGIATIAGFYLAAVTETFGVVGDAIRVTLDNGQSFSVIIADIKSSHDSNYCQWGHIQNGKVNVIEWEIVKVENGRAVLSGSSTAGYPCDVSGWQGVPVRTIEHIGKKFSLSWR
jgi:hypothetical protein